MSRHPSGLWTRLISSLIAGYMEIRLSPDAMFAIQPLSSSSPFGRRNNLIYHLSNTIICRSCFICLVPIHHHTSPQQPRFQPSLPRLPSCTPPEIATFLNPQPNHHRSTRFQSPIIPFLPPHDLKPSLLVPVQSLGAGFPYVRPDLADPVFSNRA